MAPVLTQMSSMTPYSCMCRGALSDNWEWFLPITRRGHYFQDSFFETTRSHFDDAIRDILRKWDSDSMLTDSSFTDTTSLFNRYRQLRSKNLKEENQALTFLSDNNGFKVTLDAHDFMDGEVKVKVIKEKELLIEGLIEKKEAGASSVQKFSRQFILPPDVDVDRIASVMSSDGILTITAPKKMSAIRDSVDISVQRDTSSTVGHQASSGASQSSQNSSNTSCMDRFCENCYKKLHSEKESSQEFKQNSGINIPVQVTSTTGNNTSSQTQNSQSTMTDSSFSSQNKTLFTENKEGSAQPLRRNIPIQVDKESESKATSDLFSGQHSKHSQTQAQTSINEQQSTKSLSKMCHDIPISLNNFGFLPIMRRGQFFNDSFFQDVRKDFQTAVEDVLSKWGERSSLLDNLSTYRNLRARDLREENQAVNTTEDNNNHKIVMDVKDFMDGGEVNVKAINQRELVVEGKIDKQEGGSTSVKRFLKRFVLPSDIKLHLVSSVVSSDGVLTIIAPKQPSTIQITEVTTPLKLTTTQETASSNLTQNQTKNFDVSQKTSCGKSCDFSRTNEDNSVKEHVIPVQVEGYSQHNKQDQRSHVETVSKDTSVKSKHSGEHIIPINIEGTSGNISIDKHQNLRKEETTTTDSESKSRSGLGYVIPVNVEGSSDTRTSEVQNQNTSVNKNTESKIGVETIIPVNENKSHTERYEEHIKHKKQNNSLNEHVIPVHIEGSEQTIKRNTDGERYPDRIEECPLETVSSKNLNEENQQEIRITKNDNSNMEINTAANHYGNTGMSGGRILPIVRKGSFFNDSFFDNSRQIFQDAVKDVLLKTHENSNLDDFSAYRNLRQRNLTFENQAVRVYDDEHLHKVVLDVKDFLEGDVAVNITNEKELLIEGRRDNKMDASSSSLNFCRRFLLPESVDVQSITSAISSDGILTVESQKTGTSGKQSNNQKMSSEVHSKQEAHSDSGHQWEEKAVKESLEEAPGYSCRSYATTYKAHQEQTSKKAL